MTENAVPSFEGPRPCRPQEIPEVIELLNRGIRVARGNEPTIARDWGFIYSPENAENVIIMTTGGRIVASTGIWVNEVQLGAALLRVGGINCVLTEPEFRRHGLGMQVMEACHRRMTELGCHLGLLGTRIPNWYRRMGWEYAGSSRTYELNRGNIDLLPELPAGVTAEPAGLEALDEIAALREHYPLGGIRSAETFGALLTARNLNEFLVARQDGPAVAYLLSGGRHIYEWAGPPAVVAGLIRAWYERADDRAISTSTRREERVPLSLEHATLTAPAAVSNPLTYLLDNLHMPGSMNYLGMIRLLDPHGAYQACGRHDVRAVMNDDHVTVSRGRRSITLNLCQGAKLVFGPEPVGEGEIDVKPLPFFQWSLEHV